MYGTDLWFGVTHMGNSMSALRVSIAFFLLSSVTALTVAEPSDLEVFAGEDKVIKVGELLEFIDARIVSPDPVDPDLTYSFAWDFDSRTDMDLDGITTNDGDSHERMTSWQYHLQGSYTVTLTISDGVRKAIDNLVVTVVNNYPPEISTEGNMTAPLGVPVLLNVIALDLDHDHSDLNWDWQFGDGTMSNYPGPLNHTYDEVGDHLVTVMVRDPYQALARATFTVTVMFVDDTSPIARAGRDVMVGLNETAFFDGSASSDNVEVVSWTWTFEYRNGLVSLAGPTPSFEFEEAGTYVVGLRVHDARGNAGIDTITVTVGTDVADDDYADGFAASALVVDRHLWVNLAGLLVLAMAFVVSIVVNEGLSKHHETTRDLKVFFRNSSLERTR